jgi:hypothetical protein
MQYPLLHSKGALHFKSKILLRCGGIGCNEHERSSDWSSKVCRTGKLANVERKHGRSRCDHRLIIKSGRLVKQEESVPESQRMKVSATGINTLILHTDERSTQRRD